MATPQDGLMVSMSDTVNEWLVQWLMQSTTIAAPMTRTKVATKDMSGYQNRSGLDATTLEDEDHHES